MQTIKHLPVVRFFVSLLMLIALSSHADVNLWTKTNSGNWDDASSWSLGVLPDSSQSVLITNSGWKAVVINPSAPVNFPDSMTVSNLTIAGATNTENTLLLNFFGTTTPLHVLTDLDVGTYGHVQMFSSGLTVDNLLNVQGQFDQDGGQLTFTNSSTNTMQIEGGHFNLTNGFVTGENLYLGGTNDGFATQAGGLVSLDWLILGLKSFNFDNGGGTYNLQSGWLMVSHEGIGYHGIGTLIQDGGTNSAGLLFVGPGNYLKNGGGLFAGEVDISVAGSGVTHSGGSTTISNLVHLDAQGGSAVFNMFGGSLSTPRIEMISAGLFSQSNGTVNVTGELFMEQNRANADPNTYYLNGGNLFTAKTTLSSDDSSFIQGGGMHVVTNQLWINSGTSIYQFQGGTLTAPNILLTGNISQPPQFFVLGAAPYAITNENISLTGGAVVIQDSAQQFGRLTITSDSGINLAGDSAILRFADSHTNSWASELFGVIPKLKVYNWNGSFSGGGTDQLIFGTNQSALTSTQITQIQFIIGTNTYPGKILSTGEVVPDESQANSGPVNSWITAGSGNWDQPTNWSLGILPNSTQSVLITNPVWKAVAINPTTPVNFHDSMTVSNLTIIGATNTENTLLLNFFGTGVPLTVLNGLTLQDYAQILDFNSGLDVQGGTIIVTNSQINQDGGFIRTTNAPLYLRNSTYNLTNGNFEAGSVFIGWPVSARFNQYGGTAIITNLELESFVAGPIANGISLYGGTLDLPGGMSLFGEAGGVSYLQSGGTNHTTQVTIEPDYGGWVGGFTLNGGLLADSGFEIMGGYETPIAATQNGGSHVITNTLHIAGYATHAIADPATYNMNGGTLSAGVLELAADDGDSVFIQSNGTVSAQTIYAHSVGYYSSFNTYLTLAGGTLSCSNLTVIDGGDRFNQSGGSLVVSNLLDFSGSRNVGVIIYGRYTLTGGTLTASNINNAADWLIGDGTTNRISNPGYFRLSHLLQISNAVEQLGRFILASNATINLAGSASRLSFAPSGNESWSGGAQLTISNWNGSASGGGAEQLKFGTNQSGLTTAQLNQIQFVAGTNFYSAKILNTGEVVPDQSAGPLVTFSTQGNNLVLSWPSGWSLQSATNVVGPYLDVTNATSPYTNDMMLDPRRFFRLKQ